LDLTGVMSARNYGNGSVIPSVWIEITVIRISEFGRRRREGRKHQDEVMAEEKHNVVIVGAGIIGRNNLVSCANLFVGCCTAYYITRHPAFSLKTHTLSILEASSPASGASGKVSLCLSF
jgi:hypothetical protein